MNALLVFAILALATPIFGDEAVDQKNQQKRGVVGLGYGNYYNGLHGYGGYAGYPHGYVNPYYQSAHYSAPLAYGHGYSGYHAPAVYSAPLRLPYAGYGGYNHGYYNW